MSRDTAKGHFDPAPLDPPTGFITVDDMKAFTDTVYDDIAAATAGTPIANVPFGFKGVAANTAALPTTATDGDVIVTADDGHIHVFHAGSWNNIGPTTAATAAGLPDTSTADEGDVLQLFGPTKTPTWSDNLNSALNRINDNDVRLNGIDTKLAALFGIPDPDKAYVGSVLRVDDQFHAVWDRTAGDTLKNEIPALDARIKNVDDKVAAMPTIQHGTVTGAPVSAQLQVTFDKPFATVPTVVLSMGDHSTFDGASVTLYPNNITEQGFYINGSAAGSSFSNTTSFKINWIAVA